MNASMSAPIRIHQACYTSLPHQGWHTAAISPDCGVQAGLLEDHCRFDYWPDRSENQMPLDFGYRHLNADAVCVYRANYPAGADEFNRPVHLVHSLVLSKRDFARIDADVLALLAWAERENVFYEHTAKLVEDLKPHEMQLPTREVPKEEFHQWREQQNQRPLIEWLDSFPENCREKIAKAALRLAFSAEGESRPIVWIERDNLNDRGQRQRGLLDFLFAALPYAWRRRATFSTYRPPGQLYGYFWMCTLSDGPHRISEEQRLYDFRVLNEANPEASSSPPKGELPSWINWILEDMHSPFHQTRVGKLRPFVDQFDCPAWENLVDSKGFLIKATQGRQALAQPEKLLIHHNAPNHWLNIFEFFKEYARVPHPGLLDELHRSLEQHPLLDFLRGINLEATFVECYFHALSQLSEEEFSDPPRQKSICKHTPRLAQLALKYEQPELITNLLGQLHGQDWVPDLVDEIFRKLPELFQKEQDLTRIAEFERTLTQFLPEGSRGGEILKTFQGEMLGVLERSDQWLTPEVIQQADDLLRPYCFLDPPVTIEDFHCTLNTLKKLSDNDGPEWRPDYLCHIGQSDENAELFEQLKAKSRYLLLEYAPYWEAAHSRLPPQIQRILSEVKEEKLWSSFWDGPRMFRRDDYLAQLTRELTNVPAGHAGLVKLYQSEGASKLRGELRQLRMKFREISGLSPEFYEAHLALLRLLCPSVESADDLYFSHVRELWLLLLHEGSRVTAEEDLSWAPERLSQLFLQDAKICRLVPWEFFCELCYRIVKDRSKKMLHAPTADFFQTWKDVWTRPSSTPVEGIASVDAKNNGIQELSQGTFPPNAVQSMMAGIVSRCLNLAYDYKYDVRPSISWATHNKRLQKALVVEVLFDCPSLSEEAPQEPGWAKGLRELLQDSSSVRKDLRERILHQWRKSPAKCADWLDPHQPGIRLTKPLGSESFWDSFLNPVIDLMAAGTHQGLLVASALHQLPLEQTFGDKSILTHLEDQLHHHYANGKAIPPYDPDSIRKWLGSDSRILAHAMYLLRGTRFFEKLIEKWIREPIDPMGPPRNCRDHVRVAILYEHYLNEMSTHRSEPTSKILTEDFRGQNVVETATNLAVASYPLGEQSPQAHLINYIRQAAENDERDTRCILAQLIKMVPLPEGFGERSEKRCRKTYEELDARTLLAMQCWAHRDPNRLAIYFRDVATRSDVVSPAAIKRKIHATAYAVAFYLRSQSSQKEVLDQAITNLQKEWKTIRRFGTVGWRGWRINNVRLYNQALEQYLSGTEVPFKKVRGKRSFF